MNPSKLKLVSASTLQNLMPTGIIPSTENYSLLFIKEHLDELCNHTSRMIVVLENDSAYTLHRATMFYFLEVFCACYFPRDKRFPRYIAQRCFIFSKFFARVISRDKPIPTNSDVPATGASNFTQEISRFPLKCSTCYERCRAF